MPLSEDEQRILHEMEQKLYEHERGFVGRVRHPAGALHRTGRLSLALFVLGFVLLILSFRQSLLLATIGFLVMLRAALVFERGSRANRATTGDAAGGAGPTVRPSGIDDALGSLKNRIRTRFHQH